MAAVTSLGLHQPTGLQYAVQEGLLPPEPPSSSYSWHNYTDGDVGKSFDGDELLVTPRCVIWSRGGIFRKSYRFDLENEPVTQALLTEFPSVGPLTKDGKGLHEKPRSTAIVVFLKTQAHVYFLTGTSHVIHLPFEVESASAAPNGLIIQRKLRADNLAAGSLKFPRVPPNSFVSSQPQPWSAASSQQSTFSIADLGAPMQMPLPYTSTLKDLWDPPALKKDLNWPRSFSLSDPLAEMGLVVAQPPKSESRGHRRSSTKISALDTAEEILHISHRGEFNKDTEHPLVLALTLNRETSHYSVWKLSYIGQESVARQKQRVTSGATTRRRSSFVPGATTGATTPVLSSQQTVRESFGGNAQVLGVKKRSKQDDTSKDTGVDFASTLDPDFENSTIPRRKSRRVSSMLARADLSASHERSAFSDLATVHATARRGESMGSQHARTSTGGFGVGGQGHSQGSQFNNSISSYLEAPVDDLLDELRAGGDFEGFHNMGLDDAEFDALSNEIILTKVGSVPAEHSNIRYSSQHMSAKGQCKIFTLTAPASAEVDQTGKEIVICILDPDEKRLLVLTLHVKNHKSARIDHNDTKMEEKNVDVVTLGPVMRANNVIDACRLDDGQISRILALTETSDGFGELSLQAPWSTRMKVSLPGKFIISNIRNLGHSVVPRAKREGGFKRVLSQGPRALRGLRNSKSRGFVDLVDDEGKMHQLQILLEPRNPHVRRILEVCSAVVPAPRAGEGVLVAWWNVMQWLRLESIEAVDSEWTALVVTLFSLIIRLNNTSKQPQHRTQSKRKPRTGLLRSSSGAQEDLESWEIMQTREASNGTPFPSWAENRGWKWVTNDDHSEIVKDYETPFPVFTTNREGKDSFLHEHAKLARDFSATTFGQSVISTSLPTSGNETYESQKAALADIFVGLHLLREEQRLDTMTSDSLSSGIVSLTPVLSQIARWFRWESWVAAYDVEEALLLETDYDLEVPLDFSVPQPFACPGIYSWIQTCLTTKSSTPFVTLPELVNNRSTASTRYTQDLDHWSRLTPRTLLFAKFFSSIRSDWSAAQFVEGLSAAGMDLFLLETLPEAVLAPLQEAIVECQTEPPTTWSKDLLAIVGREDVNMLLSPGQRPRHALSTLLVWS
jgi:anaphase-promoting complex subunit 1